MKKFLLCQVVVGVATASTDHNEDINNFRKLQDATRPPKTPPPTPARTRPPKTPPPTPSPTATETLSIAQTVCSEDQFFKLCSYLELTGLYETLNSDGTYTLFAPNDAAFEQLTTILPDLSDEEIKGMLLYHVAPSEITYKDLMAIAPGDIETMVPGLPIGFSLGSDGEILLNGSTKITEPDIDASNGIIQVIDQVIMPQIVPSTTVPTTSPVTAEPTSNPTEVITPSPTFKPTTAAPFAQGGDTKMPTTSPTAQVDTKIPTTSPTAQVDTKTPTTSPTAQVDTMSPTLQPTSKVITEPPTEFPTPYGNDTPEPTNDASIIEFFDSSLSVSYGVFASKSRKSSGSSKSSKSKSSKSKSAKSYEIQGKAGKSSGSSKYYATRNVSMRKVFGEGEFSNARFRADMNGCSLLRGGSGYLLVTALAAAWYWLN